MLLIVIYPAFARAQPDGCREPRGGVKSIVFMEMKQVGLVVNDLALKQPRPAPLSREKLIDKFKTAIDGGIIPYISPNEKCFRPKTVVLDDQNEIEKFSQQPGNLTIFVRLQILKYTNPQIAILRSSYFRPEASHTNIGSQVYLGQDTAVPLNLPEDEIADFVSRFSFQFGAGVGWVQ